MIYVTRRMHFCAAHRLYNESLSEEENLRRFGACVHLHGHSYTLEVTFSGEPDPKTGMLIHLSRLDEIATERVVRHLDHKNLNQDVDAFRKTPPTVEMLARYAWERLDGSVPGARLHRVRVHEDELAADYYGDGS